MWTSETNVPEKNRQKNCWVRRPLAEGRPTTQWQDYVEDIV